MSLLLLKCFKVLFYYRKIKLTLSRDFSFWLCSEVTAAVETNVIFFFLRGEYCLFPFAVSFVDYFRKNDNQDEYHEGEEKIGRNHKKEVGAQQQDGRYDNDRQRVAAFSAILFLKGESIIRSTIWTDLSLFGIQFLILK